MSELYGMSIYLNKAVNLHSPKKMAGQIWPTDHNLLTLNLNTPIKGRDCQTEFKKQDPAIYCEQQIQRHK